MWPPNRVCRRGFRHPSSCTTRFLPGKQHVTLSLYTDNCGLGPGEPLVSGIATVPKASTCYLAVATLSGAPALQEGVKYWVIATTDETQAQLDATWYGSNNAQVAIDRRRWLVPVQHWDASISGAIAQDSAPVSGARFGVTPKQTFPSAWQQRRFHAIE